MAETIANVMRKMLTYSNPMAVTLAMLKTGETTQLGDFTYAIYKVINLKYAGEEALPYLNTIYVPAKTDYFAKTDDIVFLQGLKTMTSVEGRAYNTFEGRHILPITSFPDRSVITDAMRRREAYQSTRPAFTVAEGLKFF